MSSHQLSRRTLARGAAWAAPVVAVAVAAPAFAASPGSVTYVTAMGGCRCGTGGGPVKTLRLDVTFTNTTGSTFTVTNPAIVINGTASPNVALQVTSPAQTNVVPVGTKILHYTFQRGSNPASGLVTFSYTVTDTTTNESTTHSQEFQVSFYTCSNTCVG
jgi:hypothetical protein